MTTENTAAPLRRHPWQLPATASDLERKSLRTRTLNDFVEDVFLKLFDSNEQFRELLDAVGNADAVEGSVVADDILAAQMIREAAPQGSPVEHKSLWAIRHALRVVLRRYGVSRQERARMLGGELVPNGNSDEGIDA